MSYSAQTFVADEQPTTAKWNILWSNDASFNDGTGIADNAILNRHIPAAEITGTKFGEPIAFKAYDSSGTSFINSSPTKATFGTEVYDYGSAYSTATSRFTAPYAGLYALFTAVADFSSSATRSFISFYKNGAEFARSNDGSSRGNSFATTVLLAASDYIEVYAFQTSGANRTGSALEYAAFFQGFLVGRTD